MALDRILVIFVTNREKENSKNKKVLLLRSTLTLWRRAAKVIAPC